MVLFHSQTRRHMIKENPNPLALYSSGKLVEPRFTLEGLRIFISPLNTNDGLYLSQIPIPARGKDKNATATGWPNAGGTSIYDVIVML